MVDRDVFEQTTGEPGQRTTSDNREKVNEEKTGLRSMESLEEALSSIEFLCFFLLLGDTRLLGFPVEEFSALVGLGVWIETEEDTLVLQRVLLLYEGSLDLLWSNWPQDRLNFGRVDDALNIWV